MVASFWDTSGSKTRTLGFWRAGSDSMPVSGSDRHPGSPYPLEAKPPEGTATQEGNSMGRLLGCSAAVPLKTSDISEERPLQRGISEYRIRVITSRVLPV